MALLEKKVKLSYSDKNSQRLSAKDLNPLVLKCIYMLKQHLILPWLLFIFQPLNAKVEAPNYNFSIETLENFYPDKKIADAQTKFGKPEEMSSKGEIQTLKFMVAQIRYKFPVIVHVKEGVIEDMFAKLPSYFLHDLFFQSIVNRLGKQTEYKKTMEEAFYVWKTKDFKYIYSASCTITCFPIFYSVERIEKITPSIIDQMKASGR